MLHCTPSENKSKTVVGPWTEEPWSHILTYSCTMSSIEYGLMCLVYCWLCLSKGFPSREVCCCQTVSISFSISFTQCWLENDHNDRFTGDKTVWWLVACKECDTEIWLQKDSHCFYSFKRTETSPSEILPYKLAENTILLRDLWSQWSMPFISNHFLIICNF